MAHCALRTFLFLETAMQEHVQYKSVEICGMRHACERRTQALQRARHKHIQCAWCFGPEPTTTGASVKVAPIQRRLLLHKVDGVVLQRANPLRQERDDVHSRPSREVVVDVALDAASAEPSSPRISRHSYIMKAVSTG